jgi:cyclohexa-1,5-dienecarbonyl-CoA hydratase
MTEVEFQSIKVAKADGLGKLVLCRPPLNILNIAMLREINTALRDFAQDDKLKAVVITSEGKAFSAGVDVKDHTAEKVREMITAFHEVFENLRAISAPTVALVRGAALGGGCELATFCDLVIAADDAKFGQPEIKVGVFPPIAAVIFPTLIGMKKALELILTGGVLDAHTAQQVGLVNCVLSSENFEAEAAKLLEKLTSNSGVVLRLAKRAVYETLGLSYVEAVQRVEHLYLEELMRTEDAHEGLAAFLEKRNPVWKDR